MFGVETIDRFLTSSYDQFAPRAHVAIFLPLLAEQFARQRLTELARVEGGAHDGRPDPSSSSTHRRQGSSPSAPAGSTLR
ncbi:MAG TPA: hypothetical protein VGK17_10070 [Propionicimonas sp.]